MSSNSPQIDIPVLTTFENRDITQNARSLGKILFDTVEYQTFLKALNEVNDNADIQRLSLHIREHNTALQWGNGDPTEHQSALEELNQEMENLPCVCAYNKAETVIVRLCHQID